MKIMKREEALKLRTKFYYTGKLCKNGHDSVRFTSSASCRKCQLKNSAAHRKRKYPIRPKTTYNIDKTFDHLIFHGVWKMTG